MIKSELISRLDSYYGLKQQLDADIDRVTKLQLHIEEQLEELKNLRKDLIYKITDLEEELADMEDNDEQSGT